MKNEFIIGLGGQGGRSIQELKRTIELRSGDANAIRKAGCMIDYLYIDSNTDITGEDITTNPKWSVFGTSIALDPDQIIQLKPEAGMPDMEELRSYPNIGPWLGDIEECFRKRSNTDEDTVRQTLQTMDGAGQLRRYGRVLFAMNADKVRSVIEQKLQKLKKGRTNEVTFRIFCTLGGGTGSGSLIDMITLIQSIVAADGTTVAKLIVYAYVGASDAKASDSGSFYENEYCSLRDLNALAVSAYHPFVTGVPVNDARDCYFNQPSPVNRVYLSSDYAPGSPGLDDQIASLTAACFDSIVYEHCYQNTSCLRAISDEDLVDVTPGETDKTQKIVRSYRFATLGSRRWRVPTAQIRQLLNCDIEERVWNAFLKGTKLPEGCTREVDKLEDYAFEYASTSLAEAYKKIETEVLSPIQEVNDSIEGAKRRDAAVLQSLKEASEQAVIKAKALPRDQQKKQLLVPEFKNAVAQAEAELVRCLDRAVTWGNKTEVWGIEDVLNFLKLYKDRIATWADTVVKNAKPSDVDKTESGIRERMTKREAEWHKLGTLTIACTKLDEKMIAAQLQDARNRVLNALRPYHHAIVKQLGDKVLTMIRALETSVEDLKKRMERCLDEVKKLQNTLQHELGSSTKTDGLNIKDVYEYDAENLKKIRAAMDEQEERFQDEMFRFAAVFKNAVGEGNALITCDSDSLDKFEDKMRNETLDGVMTKIHDAAKDASAAASVLVGDIVERLFQVGGEIQGNWGKRLLPRVQNFMANMPVSAEIRGNDGLKSPQVAPAAAIVIGLPRNTRHAELVDWLKEKIESAKPTKFTILGGRLDFYEHDTPEEIRVLYIPYWMPCRFARVMEFVEKKYRETVDKGDVAKIYFANYDDSGMDMGASSASRPALTKSGEDDIENMAKTELASKLYVKYKGKKYPVCARTDSAGIMFAGGVDSLTGIGYEDEFKESQVRLPGQSYKSALNKAILLAINPAPEGASYEAMSRDELVTIFQKYVDDMEALTVGSSEYKEASERQKWVRSWLKL